MESTGTIYLKIRLRLNQNISIEQVNDFIQELDYNVTDQAGLICDTEIIDCETP